MARHTHIRTRSFLCAGEKRRNDCRDGGSQYFPPHSSAGAPCETATAAGENEEDVFPPRHGPLLFPPPSPRTTTAGGRAPAETDRAQLREDQARTSPPTAKPAFSPTNPDIPWAMKGEGMQSRTIGGFGAFSPLERVWMGHAGFLYGCFGEDVGEGASIILKRVN